MLRLGVDTGGTFTDFVVATESSSRLLKLPSTPKRPSDAVKAGVRLLDLGSFDLAHGTTVATNAILERTLARTAFVTNRGFEHMLFLGRQTRPAIYELEPDPPRHPLSRDDCFGVAGRLLPNGDELEPLDLDDVAKVAANVRQYEAVAVCLLFAYANPQHECAISRALPNDFISPSHAVSPEFREYERASSTFLNAALMPLMCTYLAQIAGTDGAARVDLMASSGGLIPLEVAADFPLSTVTSGPAAGVLAARHLAASLGRHRVIAFDMGGTSTDVALIDGAPAMTSLGEIGGLPVRLNRIDVQTIGCGGGSIVWRDDAGALRVGPRSAGADPGPALYGKGRLLTVTDADFALGRLPVESLGGGSRSTSAGNSRSVLSSLATNLDTTPSALAEGIVGIAEAQMARALRTVSAARGKDPSDFSLVAYGGAAGMHACPIATTLGIPEIIFPLAPGVFSAYGLLCAPYIVELTAALLGQGVEPALVMQRLRADAISALSMANPSLTLVADLRFKGQSHEIPVPVEYGEPPSATEDRFRRLHRERYGVEHRGTSVEWVCARARAEAAPRFVPPQPDPHSTRSEALHAPRRETSALIWEGEPIEAQVYYRLTLPKHVNGPAIILQPDTTILLPPGWLAETAANGALIASRV